MVFDSYLFIITDIISCLIILLSCFFLVVTFPIKKYRFPFIYALTLVIAIAIDSLIYGIPAEKLSWSIYILAPLYVLVNFIAAWSAVITFAQASGWKYLNTKKSRLLLLIPEILPVVIVIIEMCSGNFMEKNISEGFDVACYWSILFDEIINIVFIVFGFVILVLSSKELLGTEKTLVASIIIALFNLFVWELLSYFEIIREEVYWIAYAISILIMFFSFMRISITHDNLTSIKNRAAFDKAIKLETRPLAIRKNYLYLVVADINSFKAINDTYGHDAGDKIISHVAKVLDSKAKDFKANAYRTGGDEFAIIFSDHKKENVEKFINTVNKSMKCSECQMEISLSMGVCEYQKGTDVKSFLIAADKKMYEQKNNKKQLPNM